MKTTFLMLTAINSWTGDTQMIAVNCHDVTAISQNLVKSVPADTTTITTKNGKSYVVAGKFTQIFALVNKCVE